MSRSIYCNSKQILKISTGYYDYLHQAMLQVIDDSRLELKPNIAEFIEMLDYYDLDVSEYLKTKEDVLTFAQLIPKAIELKKKSESPFRAAIESFFWICYYELILYANSLSNVLPVTYAIRFVCQDRWKTRDVALFPADLCERLYNSLRHTCEQSLNVPPKIVEFIEEIKSASDGMRTVNISTYIQTREDLAVLIDLVGKALKEIYGSHQEIDTLIDARLQLFYYSLIYYDHFLEFYDAQGNRLPQ